MENRGHSLENGCLSFYKQRCLNPYEEMKLNNTDNYNKYVWYRKIFQQDDGQIFMEKILYISIYVTADSSVKHTPLVQFITLQFKTAGQRHWIDAAGHQRWEVSQHRDIVPSRERQTVCQTIIVAECLFVHPLTHRSHSSMTILKPHAHADFLCSTFSKRNVFI